MNPEDRERDEDPCTCRGSYSTDCLYSDHATQARHDKGESPA